MNFDALFTNPGGRVTRPHFLPAMIVVLAAIGFFLYLVTGRTAQFCVLVLMYPAYVLLIQRFRDMGTSVWLPLVPLILAVASLVVQLDYISFGNPVNTALPWLAIVVAAVFILWACVGTQKI